MTTGLPLHNARSFLLVPFEDNELPRVVKDQFPDSTLTVYTKQDFAGKSFADLIRQLRSRAWDVAVVSRYSSAVRRGSTSLELLVGLARAKRRFLRLDREAFLEITFARLLFLHAPKLLLGVIVGGLLIVWTHLLLISYRRPQDLTGRVRE